MSKKTIAREIADSMGIKQFEAYDFIDLLIDVLGEFLSSGKKISLSSFGTFIVKEKKPKAVLNPANRQRMTIPGRKAIKFVPSKVLKKSIQGDA